MTSTDTALQKRVERVVGVNAHLEPTMLALTTTSIGIVACPSGANGRRSPRNGGEDGIREA